MLLPATCPICDRPGAAPCPGCCGALHLAPPVPPPPGLAWCRSLLAFDDGGGRALVARLKYRNARAALGWLADGMAGLVGEPVAVVTWAPTTPARRRERGFDQAELLARAVARRLHVPCRRLLRRRPGPHQTGRSLAERRHGVAFVPVRARLAVAGPVLVVDDVLTSGSSLAAAAAALRRAGVGTVCGLTAARTPVRGRSPGQFVH